MLHCRNVLSLVVTVWQRAESLDNSRLLRKELVDASTSLDEVEETSGPIKPVKLIPVDYGAYCGHRLTETQITAAAPPANHSAKKECPRIPSAAITDNWLCEADTNFCTDLRASKLVSRGELAAAVKPRGHVGDRALLHERMQDAWTAKRLSIVVFGTSVTCGAHCARPWPARVAQLLEHADIFGVPQQIDLQVYAAGGVVSQWALSRLGEYADRLSRAHIVLIDMSMSDTVDLHTSYSSIASTTKALVSMLGTLATPPAVVYVETFSYDTWHRFRQQEQWCSQEHADAEVFATVNASVGQRNTMDPCSLDLRCFPHWQALKQLDVPIISYFDAVCAALPRTYQFARNGEMVFWRPGRGIQGPQHPSCDTHEFIAHLVAEFISQSLREVCSEGGTVTSRERKSHDAAKAASNPWNVSSKCLMEPSTIYEAAPSAAAVAKTQVLLQDQGGAQRFEGPQYFPALVESGSWAYAEDVKGKPGWISQKGKSGGITFQVNAKIGDIIVEYLSTYSADIGTVRCRFGNGSIVAVDGHISEKVSISAFSRIHVGPTGGIGNFTCRSDGKKFKLISLRAC